MTWGWGTVGGEPAIFIVGQNPDKPDEWDVVGTFAPEAVRAVCADIMEGLDYMQEHGIEAELARLRKRGGITDEEMTDDDD